MNQNQDSDKTFYYTLDTEEELDPEIAADLKKMFSNLWFFEGKKRNGGDQGQRFFSDNLTFDPIDQKKYWSKRFTLYWVSHQLFPKKLHNPTNILKTSIPHPLQKNRAS